ncbi:trans-1,2-dihydrobenzene-1,2-diol dehydrogenase-like [Wyeomyia smithii]|uniref:trans-1,2-dihydrobenzene-1,2-diol dehydrogenase-like n=1 Tax=Wyeomyia smithii TaxID=174621 RepID=UPI002467FA67|nr:trans-1,2-dihydrobenzene-1,2-diol dehydrogenase-like [Wyeomyia smithii]
MAPLRWGIASVGLISHDFVTALATLPKEDHQVVAVAARKLEDAEKFAKKHDIEKFYEGYDALGKDPTVDVVYIGAIVIKHFELGKMMLDYGKHVLCEKPLCVNEGQAKQLLNHAKEKKLFFMEAIWSRFFPAYIHLKKRIDSGELGDITEVEAEFGYPLAGIERCKLNALGGGTILDLGVYTIQVSLWVFRDYPVKITAKGQLNDDGVDVAMEATLDFPKGGVARIKTSALGLLNNKAVIRGTKGTIILHDFWSCVSLTDIDGSLVEFPLPKARYDFNFPNSCNLRYEAEATRQHILAGKLESESIPHSESLRIARIEDALRRQIGVRYAEDEQFKA